MAPTARAAARGHLIQISALRVDPGSDDAMFARFRPADAPLTASGVAPVELDLRRLPAPEPMLRALAMADALRPGECVCVLTPLLPIPLLDALTTRGLRHVVEPDPGGGVRVLILHPRSHGTPRD